MEDIHFHLIDTNVFIEYLEDRLYEVIQKCEKIKVDLTITDEILRELQPSKKSDMNKDLSVMVENYCKWKKIKYIDLDSAENEEIKKRYKAIRKTHYSWIKDTDYLRNLIEKGVLEKKEIKNLKYRDVGECQLIAFAIENKDSIIVTQDKGKVYKHPEIDLFDLFKKSDGVQVYWGDSWLQMIGCNC